MFNSELSGSRGPFNHVPPPSDPAIRGLVAAVREGDDLSVRSLLRCMAMYAGCRTVVGLYTALYEELGPP